MQRSRTLGAVPSTLLLALLLATAGLTTRADENRREPSDTDPTRSIRTQPPRLDLGAKEPADLRFRDKTSVFDIYHALGQAFDLRILFDPNLEDQKFTLDMEQVTAHEALNLLRLNFGHVHKVLDRSTLLVADDTPQNRRRYEDQLIRTVYLENSEIKDAMTILRSLLGLKHVAADEAHNSITFRDSVATVTAAEEVLNTFDQPRAELEISVELLEIDQDTLHELTASEEGAGPSLRLDAATRRQLTERARSLARPRLGILDGKHVRVRFTDRLPIGGDDLAEKNPVVEVGWELTVKPMIHSRSREITLDLHLAVSGIESLVEGSQRPVVSGRDLETTVRLQEGESCLISGILSRGGPEGTPFLGGLANLPSPEHESEVVVLLTPRIIRGVGFTKDDLRPLWVGTEERMRIPTAPAPELSAEQHAALEEGLRERLREGQAAAEDR